MNTALNEPIALEIVQAIVAQAGARGVSVNEYLRLVFGLMNDTQSVERPFYETATPEEWIQEFTKWAESHGPNSPGLTREDVSRERMYED